MEIQNNQENIKNFNTLNSLSTNPQPEGKLTKRKKIILGVGGLVVLAVIVIGIVTRGGNSEVLKPIADKDLAKIEADKRTEVAPLTGELFTPEQAKAWQNTRPLAVMINNHTSARPQSGLNKADLVYEIVAEGGITRFLAFFNTEIPEKIGPVRSTREYYLVLVKELGDAMVMHIGWSPQALEAIETWPVRSLGRGGGQFWRDEQRLASGVPTEHTAYVDGKELVELSKELGWEGTREFDLWKYKDSGESTSLESSGSSAQGTATTISIDFWTQGDYSAIWNYDAQSNSYLRFMGYNESGDPIEHKDQESGDQISVKNVIVQFAEETNVLGDDKGRLEYGLIGSGEAVVFTDGKYSLATWNKSDRDARTMFYDQESGEEIVFNRGQTWISIVPDRNVDQVIYE